jgi:single-strand DNA-binding protein
MKSLNNVQLIGWLGSEPKIITLKDGRRMAKLRMATDIYIPQSDGGRRKITTWHTVKLWRQKQIEYYRNYLTKGSHILVDGRLEYRRYQNKNGFICTAFEILANYVVDLDR